MHGYTRRVLDSVTAPAFHVDGVRALDRAGAPRLRPHTRRGDGTVEGVLVAATVGALTYTHDDDARLAPGQTRVELVTAETLSDEDYLRSLENQPIIGPGHVVADVNPDNIHRHQIGHTGSPAEFDPVTGEAFVPYVLNRRAGIELYDRGARATSEGYDRNLDRASAPHPTYGRHDFTQSGRRTNHIALLGPNEDPRNRRSRLTDSNGASMHPLFAFLATLGYTFTSVPAADAEPEEVARVIDSAAQARHGNDNTQVVATLTTQNGTLRARVTELEAAATVAEEATRNLDSLTQTASGDGDAAVALFATRRRLETMAAHYAEHGSEDAQRALDSFQSLGNTDLRDRVLDASMGKDATKDKDAAWRDASVDILWQQGAGDRSWRALDSKDPDTSKDPSRSLDGLPPSKDGKPRGLMPDGASFSETVANMRAGTNK